MTVQTHFRIVFRGLFASTPEAWSFSTKWERAVDLGPDAALSDISKTAVKTALQNLLSSTGNFHSDVKATEIRYYQIGTDGRMEGDPYIDDFSGTPLSGSSTNVRYPPDVAICVTTQAANRGHARFGRFYLPGPALALGADWRLTASQAQNLGGACKTFCEAVGAAIDVPGTTARAAMLNISDDASSTHQRVKYLRVGRVLDRVSRRRRQLLEDYQLTSELSWPLV